VASYGVELLAGEVLDQRQLEPRASGLGVAHLRRHLGEAGHLGGAQAALTGDQAVAALSVGLDEHRLENSVACDRGRQLLEALALEAGARVELLFDVDLGERDGAQLAGLGGLV
jgi:hypothetical protein